MVPDSYIRKQTLTNGERYITEELKNLENQILGDEEKVIKAKAEKENFVPNFVNPFRDSQPGFAPADTETPADKDKQ